MSIQTRSENTSTLSKQSGYIQVLTFELDDQEYGLNIVNVVQVVRMVAITRPPKAPEYVEGMVNLRGKGSWAISAECGHVKSVSVMSPGAGKASSPMR